MAEFMMPQLLDIEPFSNKKSYVNSNENNMSAKSSKASKTYSAFEIYDGHPLGSLMNWIAAFIFVFGSMLVIWAEVNFAEDAFDKTEVAFRQSETLQDRLSVHNRLAYGDLNLPTGSLDGDTVATGKNPNVLGESDEVELEEATDGDPEEVTPVSTDADDMDEIVAGSVSKEESELISEIDLFFDPTTTDKTPDITEKTDLTVRISVDGGKTETITDKFTPTLELGMHELKVTYTNDDGDQEIVFNMLVLPEAPTVDPVSADDIQSGYVTVRGESEPSAIVKVFLASEIEAGFTEADSEGNWVYQSKTKLEAGDHSVVAEAVVDGYTSKASETVSFEIEDKEELPLTGDLGSLDISPNMLLIVLGALLGGMVLAFIWMKLFGADKENELKITDGGRKNHFVELSEDDTRQASAGKSEVASEKMTESMDDMSVASTSDAPAAAPEEVPVYKFSDADSAAAEKSAAAEEPAKKEVDIKNKRSRRTEAPPVSVSLL